MLELIPVFKRNVIPGLIIFLMIICTGSLQCSGKKNTAVLVYAGAGMKDPLEKIGKAFSASTGHTVLYDFQGSGRLTAKIRAGHIPDIFIPGAFKWSEMDGVKEHVISNYMIACHEPVVVTHQSGNKIKSLYDLTKREARIVLGRPDACAIGKVSNKIFFKAGLKKQDMNIAGLSTDVVQLVQWVELKHADAAVVWRADTIKRPALKAITIAKEVNHISRIPLSFMDVAEGRKEVKEYTKYLLSAGLDFFEAEGFRVIR